VIDHGSKVDESLLLVIIQVRINKMMNWFVHIFCLIFTLLALEEDIMAYNVIPKTEYAKAQPTRINDICNNIDAPQEKNIIKRRSLFANIATTVISTAVLLNPCTSVMAAETTVTAEPIPLESVYFGVGCFWHIQHEFVAAEREILERSDLELTAFTGYAGGTNADNFGRVCYHNFQNVADYGKYGHAEVVGMKLPTDKIIDFAKVYFSLFDPKTHGMYLAHFINILLS
jgi:hypothetical protein